MAENQPFLKKELHEPKDIHEPVEEIDELKEFVSTYWSERENPKDILKNICERLRTIEGLVVRRYESTSKETQKEMDIGDFEETIEAIKELEGSLKWIWRYPSLILTVVIASCCIPFANYMENVINEHPILAGFPPAISAAAGCIGIQNTAIIIRALGVKMITSNPFYIFVRYLWISILLSLGAAIIEMFVAWIVVSAYGTGSVYPTWSLDLLFKDVPIVIFFAMLVTGSLAGIIGAGVPLLVYWISNKTQRHLDPAHWVGPIETVVQELTAALLTFWIAQTFVFN